MSRNFTSDYITYNGFDPTLPCSVMWWCKEAIDSGSQYIFDSTNGNRTLFVQTHSNLYCFYDNAAVFNAFGAGDFVKIADGWLMGLALFASADSQLRKNATQYGTSAVSITDAGSPTTFWIGRRYNNVQYWNGDIAHVVFWSIKLTVKQSDAMSRGVNPIAMFGDLIVFWTPLFGNNSPEPTYGNDPTNTGTLTGTVKGSTNPPMQLLSRYMSGH